MNLFKTRDGGVLLQGKPDRSITMALVLVAVVDVNVVTYDREWKRLTFNLCNARVVYRVDDFDEHFLYATLVTWIERIEDTSVDEDTPTYIDGRVLYP